MQINVTQEHIDNGEPNSSCYCPIALAIQDALDCDEIVSVDVHYISVSDAGYKPDENVSNWVEGFDIAHQGEPFVMVLESGVAEYHGI